MNYFFAVWAVPALLAFSAAFSYGGDLSLKERFFSDGPKGWEELRKVVKKLEGEARMSDTPRVAAEPDRQPHLTSWRFKVNHPFILWEKDWRGNGKEKKVAAGANSKYWFYLKRKEETDWALDTLEIAQPGAKKKEHPLEQAWNIEFLRFLEAPVQMMGMMLEETIRDPGFKLMSIAEVGEAGRLLVKLEFEYKPPQAQQKEKMLRKGWISFDPAKNWAIQNFDVEIEGKIGFTGVISYTEGKGKIPIVKTVRYDYTYGPGRAETVEFHLEKHKFREMPEAEFTLSTFGLPEPQGINWPEPTRWWLWIFIAAASAVGIAVGLVMLKHRYFPATKHTAAALTGMKKGGS